MNRGLGSYPSIKSVDFYKNISNKMEIKIPSEYPGYNCLQRHQKLLKNYMSMLTSYNSILIYHHVGLGKTLSAISIAENFKDKFKIIVLTKNKLIEDNFKKELVGNCSNYMTDEVRRQLETEIDEDIRKKINKKMWMDIKKNYSFKSYSGLKHQELKNTVVIIDEVHNITGNDLFKDIFGVLKKSKNTKLIMMSATPMFNSVLEIYDIVKLMNVVDKETIIENNLKKLVEKKHVKYITLGNSMNSEEKIPTLTDKGIEELKKHIKGRVSYIMADTVSFPEKIYNGENIYDKNSLIIYPVDMSPLQNEIYLKKIDDQGTLYKNASDISTMVYPDGSYGEDGFKKYISDTNPNNILRKDNIEKYSTKLHKLLLNIEKSKGIVFIYSNFVSYGGTSLLRKFLTENGMSSFSSRKRGEKFVVFGDNLSQKRRSLYLEQINSEKNKNGEIIKVVIGSPVVSEGVSFKNVRQIHVLDPYWNMSRIDQIIGRGVRFQSHNMLNKKNRNVNIFLYVSIFDKNKENSIDYIKYFISYIKDKSIQNVEHALKKASIDCFIHKKHNVKPRDMDFSKECNYKECSYICPYEGVEDVDESTYMIKNHDMDQYKFIEKCVFETSRKASLFNLKYMVELVKSKYKSISKNNIYIVLNDIIQNKTPMKNLNNIESVLVQVDDNFIVNPVTSDISESFFRKILTKDVSKKTLEQAVKDLTILKNRKNKK